MFLHQELKKAREEAGLTQSELAKIAGVPRNQVVRAEKGENITIETLRRIAVHLPVTQLTLMHNVMLKADILPQPEKIYLGAMATLSHMTGALGAALGLAMTARVALETANSREPLYQEAGEEPPSTEHDAMLLKSIESWYRELDRTVHNAGIGFPRHFRREGGPSEPEEARDDSEEAESDSDERSGDSEA